MKVKIEIQTEEKNTTGMKCYNEEILTRKRSKTIEIA